MSGYTGMSDRGEGKSVVFAEMVGDVIKIHSSDQTGLSVEFDKSPTEVIIIASYILFIILLFNGRSQRERSTFLKY